MILAVFASSFTCIRKGLSVSERLYDWLLSVLYTDCNWVGKVREREGGRERQNTESLHHRARSWSPYPWTNSDSLWKAFWSSPPQMLAASMHTDLVFQYEKIVSERSEQATESLCMCVSVSLHMGFYVCVSREISTCMCKGNSMAVLMCGYRPSPGVESNIIYTIC